ncbi:MAG: Spy/CpxP family protein refolding chaperone [Verrucomicrobia bacterium]|nr:Spy/CpxP family protein refolding chaperone [Verrucomicrobiota bacterium]
MTKKSVAGIVGGLVLAGALGLGFKAVPAAAGLHALLDGTPLRAIFEEGAAFRAEMLASVTSLNVTQDQIADIRELVKSHHSEMGPLVRQMADARKALREAIRSNPDDEAAIRAAAAKVATVEADLAVARAHVVKDVKVVLTDEQREKIKGISEKVHARVKTVLDRVDNLMAN